MLEVKSHLASERGNTEFTTFLNDLPFNITVDELREKFKRVSVSLLPLMCVTVYPLCMSLLYFCMSMHTSAYISCQWLQCGDIADI